MYRLFFLFAFFLISHVSWSKEESHLVPLHEKGASTFYINGHIDGFGSTEFMVDTGSGYTTINEYTLNILKAEGKAEYSRKLRGILADGSEKVVSVYRISSLSLGGKCTLHNIEAAIFPGKTRQILGLNALRKTGEFTLSFEPPAISLAQCDKV
jgi:predicted aspartyl protease